VDVVHRGAEDTRAQVEMHHHEGRHHCRAAVMRGCLFPSVIVVITMGCTAAPEDAVCEKKSWMPPSSSMVAGRTSVGLAGATGVVRRRAARREQRGGGGNHGGDLRRWDS
jgi:hypothetical protein